MGMPILIIGKSGSGKSTSLRNFTKEDNIGIINVLGKRLPFKSSLAAINTDDYAQVMKAIVGAKSRSIVIDDAGYLMTNQFMKGHSNSGSGNGIFAFYNDIGDRFWSLIRLVNTQTPDDRLVYFLMHEEKDEFGEIRPKTIGKMLDEKVCIEGMFTVVLRCREHKFLTQSDGSDVAKSPIGMFGEAEIDNDLKLVDETIRKYYEI